MLLSYQKKSDFEVHQFYLSGITLMVCKIKKNSLFPHERYVIPLKYADFDAVVSRVYFYYFCIQ